MKKYFLFFIVFSFVCFSQASDLAQRSLKPISPDWIRLQVELAQQRLLANISPSDALKGTVVASPSRQNPDYYYHWTRDAALVMDVVLNLWVRSTNLDFKKQGQEILSDYVVLSRLHQLTAAPGGLGEPKYYVDGRPFTGPWGRPQNDGPALRAVTLAQWTLDLLEDNQTKYIHTWLFHPNNLEQGVLSKDLLYVLQNWQKPNFDLWEEVSGDHFYTLMAQRKALRLGAQVSYKLGNALWSEELHLAADAITARLDQFYSSEIGRVMPTQNQVEGLDYKVSQLDIAVALGSLHSGIEDESYNSRDPRIFQSTLDLAKAFSDIYQINHQYKTYAPLIGRYPEDRYGGSHFDHGNPWFLTTFAVAELHYRAAATELRVLQSPQWRRKIQASAKIANISISNSQEDPRTTLVRIGDAYLLRALSHTDDQGRMAEQLDRYSGFMTSASDLTWSYASFLTAMMARSAL